ncbi:MAG: TolC family protein [Bacteroidota bacterium]|nr:TolC family protein [Bacteroidota bacterium]
MKNIAVAILCTFLTFFSYGQSQRSMMTEVSVPYLEKLIQTAKQNYPRHKIFSKQIEIAQANVSKIQLSWFDGLGIYYLYLPPNSVGGTVNPTTNRSGFQLGFSLNFGSLLEKPAQIKAAKGDKQVAILEKDEYDLNIERDVKERYYKYIQQVTLLRQRTQLALDAQTLMTTVRNKFERGEETFENFNNVQTSLNQQIQDKISTEAEMLIAKAQLEELLNEKLENIKLDDTK